MRTMFNNFFNAFAKLFSAVERGASALDHLAMYAEDEAKHFNDRAAFERQAKIRDLKERIESAGSGEEATA